MLLLFLVQRHFCWRRPSFLLLSSPVNSLVFLIWQSSCSPTLSINILLNITASSWSFLFKWTQQILLLSRQWCQSSVCRVLMTDSCWITSFIDFINVFFLLTNQVINSTPVIRRVCVLPPAPCSVPVPPLCPCGLWSDQSETAVALFAPPL